MLHYYNHYIALYYQNQQICYYYSSKGFLDEKDFMTSYSIVKTTSENFIEMYKKYPELRNLVGYRETRKGIKVWNSEDYFTTQVVPKKIILRQWKEPIELEIKSIYRKCDKSITIKDILNSYDVDNAIRYLAERGLSVIKESEVI